MERRLREPRAADGGFLVQTFAAPGGHLRSHCQRNGTAGDNGSGSGFQVATPIAKVSARVCLPAVLAELMMLGVLVALIEAESYAHQSL